MASFKMPVINENPDGWGPPMDLVPQKFTDMPYAPFSKSDRLGRAADWAAYGNRYGREGGADESGSEFTIVDNKMVPRPGGYSRGRGRGGFRGGFRGSSRGRYGDRFGDRRDMRELRARNGRNASGRGGKGYNRRYDDRRNMQREASVQVGADWVQVEEINHSVLTKLVHTGTEVDTPEDLLFCGTIPYYDRVFDRVTVKTARPLLTAPGGRDFPNLTTTDDPIIRRLAGSSAGNVFATATILATIMVASRGQQSWDIVVQRIGGKLFLDKRDGSMIDFLTVNETNQDPPKDEKNLPAEEAMNSHQHLSVEATRINSNFAQMVVDKTAGHSYAEPNPFDDVLDEPFAKAGYRYRKWTLSESITVVARCEIEGCSKPSNPGEAPKLMKIKALNEYFDPNARQNTNWRGNLETQRGAVLATASFSNAGKMARWTVEGILADVNQMKFGFVSRTVRNSNQSHVILGTLMYGPKELAAQVAINTKNMWGVLKHIIELCYKHLVDGEKCVILKDPNKPIIRLFKVPENAFESEEEEEEEEEEDTSFA